MLDSAARMIDLDDIRQARQRIADRILDTPLRQAPVFSQRTGIDLLFKLEVLQITGSFKARGALNKILALSPEERAQGVIAASAGNHAQGVAFAASSLDIPAIIVMPEITPQIKIDNTQGYGEQVEIRLSGTTYDEACQHALELQKDLGRVFIHPFDDDLVIAGQGTLGLELDEQAGELDAVVVPIGGGGLIAGIATALAALRPEVKVYGVQTEAAPAMQQSFAAKAWSTSAVKRSIAEGIAVEKPGRTTFRHIEKSLDDIVLVSERQIEMAIGDLLEVSKIVVEGAAAVGVAAILGPLRERLQGQRVAVVLTGANIDLRVMHRVIERALARTHRLVQLRSTLPDQPGSLVKFLSIIASKKGNVSRVIHDRVFTSSQIDQANVVVTLEVLNQTHVDSLIQTLTEAGYRIDRSDSPAPLPPSPIK